MDPIETTNRRSSQAANPAAYTQHEKGKGLVEARARSILRASPYRVLQHVSCEFHEGVLTLRGQVPTYYHKQIAQTLLLLRLKDVAIINNRLEVPPEG